MRFCSVGKTPAIAGRVTPGIVRNYNFDMAIKAPVFPADTTELASPSQTALIARRMLDSRADLRAKAERTGAPGEPCQHNRLARECFHSIVQCRKPIIAAINGPALGAGLSVAASCDILVAANSASVRLPEINVGLLGGGRHAMRLFGHSKTRQMMLTGLRLDGAELYRLGVVEDCVPVSDLMDVAMALAKEIAAKSPPAVVIAKHALNAIEDMSLRDGYRFEQTMTVEVGRTEDAAEATRSFLEKREPNWKE